jgi:hypothetical protein
MMKWIRTLHLYLGCLFAADTDFLLRFRRVADVRVSQQHEGWLVRAAEVGFDPESGA